MHAVIRGTLGTSLLQNLSASCAQACRCSGVPAAWEILENEKTTRVAAIALLKWMLIVAIAISWPLCEKKQFTGLAILAKKACTILPRLGCFCVYLPIMVNGRIVYSRRFTLEA